MLQIKQLHRKATALHKYLNHTENLRQLVRLWMTRADQTEDVMCRGI